MLLFNAPTPRSFLFAVLCCAGGFSLGAAPRPIDFLDRPVEGTPMASSDGTITLTWPEPAPAHRVELEQAPTVSFVAPFVRYRGRDTGSVLTGLAEGSHYFRLRLVDAAGEAGAWSEPIAAEVVFMDRGHLFWLLSLGGIVATMTMGAIVIGHFRAPAAGSNKTEVSA